MRYWYHILIMLFYYVYLTLIVFGTGYIVFVKGESGWWFLLTLIFANLSPTIKTKKD